MDKSKQQPAKDEEPQSRVDKEHGGQLVEAVSQEQLMSFNDADCTHKTLIRDDTETEFLAFACANPKCNEVVLYSK